MHPIDVFLSELNELKDFRTFQQALPPPALQAEAEAKRKYEYLAYVVGLYGILEGHTHSLVEQFLLDLSTILPFEGLPTSIQNNHLPNSLDFIKRLEKPEYPQYEGLKIEDALKNLYDCASRYLPYKLNVLAFLMNSGNLKTKQVNSLLTNVAGDFKSFFDKHDKHVEIENEINTLVDKRNLAAHRGKVEIFDDLNVDYVGVYLVLIAKFLEIQKNEILLREGKISKIPLVFQKYFQNYEAYGFTFELGTELVISQSMFLWFENLDTKTKWVFRIETLQIAGVSYGLPYTIPAHTEFGLGVSSRGDAHTNLIFAPKRLNERAPLQNGFFLIQTA